MLSVTFAAFNSQFIEVTAMKMICSKLSHFKKFFTISRQLYITHFGQNYS